MGFTALSVQPGQPRATTNLAEVVIHAMIVLQCSNGNDVTNTLRTLLMNPANMTVRKGIIIMNTNIACYMSIEMKATSLSYMN
jgi:hypothetical protein